MIFEIILGCLIFFTATAYQAGHSFIETQELVYKIGIPLLFISSLYMKPKRWVINPILNILPALALITIFFVPSNVLPTSILALVYIFLGILLFYLVANYSDFRGILPAIYGVIILNAVMVLLQATGHDPICLNEARKHNTAMVGLFGFKYVFGAWMAIVTPLLLFKKKILGIISGLLCICSLSWACIGLMLSACVFTSYFLSRRLFAIVLVLAVVVGLVSYIFLLHKPDNPILTFKYKLNSRIELESKFLTTIMLKPYTGWGVGTFKLVGPSLVNNKTGNWGTMTDGWNDYFERGVEMGLWGIALMVWLFVNAFKRFFRFKIDPTLAGSLAIVPFGIMFHNYFNHFSLSVLIICLFAWWEVKNLGEG